MSSEPDGTYSAVVADDVTEHLDILKSILQVSRRFQIVATARTGTEAISAAARFKPDLVLLDIGMPELDGLEALPMIRATSPDSKVVLISGQDADGQDVRSLGAADRIRKDLPPAALVARLLDVMSDPSPLPIPEITGVRRDGLHPAPPGVLEMTPEEMVSVVAHEVRNHLAVIQGFGVEVHTRWDELPDDMKRDSVRRMTERARYLNAVVNNLMVLRRLDAGHTWQSTTAVAVPGLMDQLRAELQDLAQGHPLGTDIATDLPRASADPHRLRQVLTNLVVNAARVSPVGKQITLAAIADERGVCIQVRDHGPGVPQRHHDRIFEKFVRLEDGGSGIGLGLFISRELMRSMSGELLLEPTPPGNGATFTCILPEAET